MNYTVSRVLIFVGMLTLPSLSYAYNIGDAIKAARENNSKIKSAREDLRTVKVEKAKAITTILPSITASADFSLNYAKSARAKLVTEDRHGRRYEVNVNQPLFSGGSSIVRWNRATHQVTAAEYGLRGVKENIILNTINAYETLLTTKQIFNLNLSNEEVLAKHLKETQVRFDLGEATITDVSQARSRLASAISEKTKASGDVISSEAFYEHIIGERAPASLDEISLNNLQLPHSLDQLIEIALQRNPSVHKAKNDAKVARNSKQLAYTALSPVVSANARIIRTDDNKDLNKPDFDIYSVNVQIPIFQRGEEYANIKAAKHQERKAKHDFDETKKVIIEEAIDAWSQYETSKSVISSTNQAILAARSAVEGVKEEAKVGTRTTLDVLDAEQELFDAKIQNRKALKENVVAIYRIHELMGLLNQMTFATSQ